MKKYIALLFIFAFIFIFNTNSAGAIVSGCVAGDKYDRNTGVSCDFGTIRECSPGDKYDSQTGKPCTLPKEEVSKPICIYPMNTELKFGSRGEEVKKLQQNLRDAGLLSGKADGVYGKMTESARQNYFKKCPMPPKDSGSVVISGVSGPQILGVGETGTWTVKAYDKNGGSLTYSVLWGDEDYKSYSPSSFGLALGSQVAEFTHVYSKAGNYTPKFTVTSENTIRCVTTPCPSNGGSASTSLSVKVGETPEPSSIKVLSPNGGEFWYKGRTQTIKWKDDSVSKNIKFYDIFLNGTLGCTGTCPAVVPDQIIVEKVSGFSYTWSIPQDLYFNGPYTVTVCESGYAYTYDPNVVRCDQSDNIFKIYKD